MSALPADRTRGERRRPDPRAELERSLAAHREELGEAVSDLVAGARERVSPGPVLARHPYAWIALAVGFGAWLGMRRGA